MTRALEPEANGIPAATGIPWLLLNLLNVLDVFLTVAAVKRGFIELNPVMAAIVHRPVLFGVTKIGVMWIGSTVLGIREARKSLWLAVAIYTSVVTWNIVKMVRGLP